MFTVSVVSALCFISAVFIVNSLGYVQSRAENGFALLSRTPEGADADRGLSLSDIIAAEEPSSGDGEGNLDNSTQSTDGVDSDIRHINESVTSSMKNRGCGKPLFLTPLIEKGKLKLARRLAKVKPLTRGVASYAGYLTVHAQFNSNLFFWFFPSANCWRKAPVALWLNGGPGASSLFGLFVENGPYALERGRLRRRRHSWHKNANVIFIDNPVGSGFSFTDSDDGYARNQTVIGKQLRSAIEQFFKLFPYLRKNEFYVTGESYAGKYVPALAYAIHETNPTADAPINLKGLFIGNGMTDPVNMMRYGDYVYQLGLIDTNALKVLKGAERRIVSHIKAKRWSEATDVFGKYIIGYYYYPYSPYFENVTGFSQHYNYIETDEDPSESAYEHFVNGNLFRRSVHVGGKPFNSGRTTAMHLKEDILQSVVHWVVELLNHYRVVFYNGQLDIICAYPLTENFLAKMKWKGAAEYRRAPRRIWKVGGRVAGYYKQTGNLTEVLVRNAGHLVPTDQPLWGRTLFEKFIFDRPL